MVSDSTAARAPSKNYRKVNKKLAEVAHVPAKHSSSPRKDFENTLDLLAKRER